jgi:hypothetical protein
MWSTTLEMDGNKEQGSMTHARRKDAPFSHQKVEI